MVNKEEISHTLWIFVINYTKLVWVMKNTRLGVGAWNKLFGE